MSKPASNPVPDVFVVTKLNDVVFAGGFIGLKINPFDPFPISTLHAGADENAPVVKLIV
jgi:hypothetical protein